MNKTIVFPFVLLITASLACGALTSVGSPQTPKKCSPQNWDILITSIKENDLGDGTKDVLLNLGVENNDQLWGMVDGPNRVNNPKPVILISTGGAEYEPTSKSVPFPLPNGDVFYAGTGFIKTPEIPPGFTVLGQSYLTVTIPYTFVFNIPSSEEPATFTIDTLQINCLGDYIIVNGETVWGGGTISVAPRTYNLRNEVRQLRAEPSANKYPSLKGSRIVLADNRGEYHFTDVKREGNTVVVTFDFLNPSTYALQPSFSGYIIGDKKVFTCLYDEESACDMEQTIGSGEVQPGQTVSNLTGVFAVPEDENNLIFVFGPSDNMDGHSNSVYNLGR